MRIRWFSLVRVTGMLMVLLYHFSPDRFQGGFVGVDLFLTFSGFLTTAVFFDEFARKEKIDIKGFFQRRLYRILPPLVLTILLVMPLTLLVRSDFRADIGRQLAATLGFVTNYYEISLGGSYENQFVPHLFLHTWSLAVEVHIYLVWGLGLWLLAKLSRSQEQLRIFVFGLSSLLFVITFVRMVVGGATALNLSTVYYATDAHSFPFFIGAILASLTGLGQTTVHFQDLAQKWTRQTTLALLTGGGAVLILLMFLLNFDNRWTYWLGFLLASLASSAMILAARLLHEQTRRSEPVFLVFLANISYGVYLFHWPFLVIFRELVSGGVAATLTLFFSLILATLSFYILEPLVMGKAIRLKGVSIDLGRAKKGFGICLIPLLLVSVVLVLVSPKMGALETDLLVSSLQQADNKMAQTRSLVDGQKATDYGVPEGTIIIGDSVTLRASEGLAANVNGILVDGVVSRTLAGAYEVMKANMANDTLPQNVVIAAGTNPVDDFASQLDRIVNELPQGHRLILVTPYDGRVVADPVSTVNQTRNYELSLADKYEWITVADWYQVALDNPQIWENSDNVHFGDDSESIMEGQNLYGQSLAQALTEASSRSVKTGKNH